MDKIIVKRDPARLGSNLIMFFPEDYENGKNYRIPCFSAVGQNAAMGYCHGECDYDFYRECTPVVYDDSNIDNEVFKFVSNYISYIQTLPDMQEYSIKMVKRISRK